MNRLLFLPLLLLLLLPVNVLRIAYKGGSIVCPLIYSTNVLISYTHSVSLTAVEDMYRVDDSGIWAIEERWQEFEAGQPMEFDRISDGYLVKKLHMFMGKSWRYWFIPLNDVCVRVGSKVIISHLKKEGLLSFGVETVPLISILCRRG